MYEVPLHLTDLFVAMKTADVLEAKLKELSGRILSMFILPIVTGTGKSVQIQKSKLYATLLMEESKSPKANAGSAKPEGGND